MSKNQTSFEYLLLIGGVLIFVLLVVNVGITISGKSSGQASITDSEVNDFQNWKLNCYNYGVTDKNNTIAYYNFDADFKDKSGNKNDLQGTGNPFISSGHIKGGVKFSSTSDAVNNSAIGSLFNFTNSTLSLWFKTSSSGGQIVNHSLGSNGWALSLNGADLAFTVSGTLHDLGVVVNDGNWHYAAIEQNNSGYYYWIDGKSYGNFINSYTAGNYAGDMFIGGISTTGIVGTIDDFKFYSKTLKALEILQDMNCTTVTS
ncbi:Concanavalin A-like lectin/glucanases superfamily protein [uncultured archaeon]|nr:Concanavalin A-like lectin/glucanases superfamily protein [uncultured archaeon]